MLGDSQWPHVDALVDAWGRERPDLDVAPLHVLSRVTRLARRLGLGGQVGAGLGHGMGGVREMWV